MITFNTYWLLTLIPIIATIVFLLIKKPKKVDKYIKFYNAVNIPNGRFGLLTTYKGSVEFREVATSSGEGKYGKEQWLKISILEIYPSNSYTKEEVTKEIKFNQWIRVGRSTDDYTITWFDDNSQRIRDEKIKEILEK